MGLRKRILFLFMLAIVVLTCRPQTTMTEATTDNKDSSALKIPDVPAPVSEVIDISGVPVESHEIAKANPENITQYRFSGGACANAENTTKIYGTYGDNVSVPISVPGNCTMEFRACSSPAVCSAWSPVSFNQASTPAESDKLRILLRQQVDQEQKLHELGLAISKDMKEASPFFDRCLAGKTDAVKMQALKDFAALTPKQIDEILQSDFSKQVNEALSGVTSPKTAEAKTGYKKIYEDISTSATDLAESTKLALLQNLALVGIPVTIFIAVENGFHAFELTRWPKYLKEQRTARIDGKDVTLVRHKESGFLVEYEFKDTPIDKLDPNRVYLEDPIDRVVVGQHVGDGPDHRVVPTPVPEFFNKVKESNGSIKMSKEHAAWMFNGKPIYFKRNWEEGGKFKVENGKVKLDDWIYKLSTEPDPTEAFYKKPTAPGKVEVPNPIPVRVKDLRKIARLEFDPRSGGLMNRKFGKYARMAGIASGFVSVTTGLTRLYAAYGLSDGTDNCTNMLSKLKAVQENMTKADPIKTDLLQVKALIGTQI